MALICNVNRDSKSRAVTGWQVWHRPGAKRPQSKALTVDFLHGLKEAFTKRRG
jgi:hypothetical protein